MPRKNGCDECDECGDTNISPSVEAFEVLNRILCEDCAPGALETAAEKSAPLQRAVDETHGAQLACTKPSE